MKKAKGDTGEEVGESGGATSSTDVDEVEVNQEEEFEADEWAIDDLTGQELDIEKVNEARKEEVEFMAELGVFEASTWKNAWASRRLPRSGSIRTRARRRM